MKLIYLKLKKVQSFVHHPNIDSIDFNKTNKILLVVKVQYLYLK